MIDLNKKRYEAPAITVVIVEAKRVIAQSPMNRNAYGDAYELDG